MLAETRQLTPLFVVLMSDLLLLTRPDPDNGSLIVLAEPLSLQDIVGSSFHCSHRKLVVSQLDKQTHANTLSSAEIDKSYYAPNSVGRGHNEMMGGICLPVRPSVRPGM